MPWRKVETVNDPEKFLHRINTHSGRSGISREEKDSRTGYQNVGRVRRYASGVSSSVDTASRRSMRPGTLPYCKDSTPRLSVLMTSLAISLRMSTGSASLAGEPPPKEMIPGSFIVPKRPRIIDAVLSMVFILCAKTANSIPLLSVSSMPF